MNCHLKKNKSHIAAQAAAILALCATGNITPAFAASFTETTFATGASVSSTDPDSVSYGGGSLWIEYSNGASSTDYSGASTLIQYNLNGTVRNRYSMAGDVDGLKYNPATGMVWALQNQDANSQLSIINPTTKSVTAYTYGAPYTSAQATRGFDDVAFIGNNVYLSETNPAATGDPVLVKLSSNTPSSPVTMSTVLTGAGLMLTDPDSLKSTPNGGLIQTGEGDEALTVINNPGTASQSAHSIALSGANGARIGKPDDALDVTSTSGTFYLTDTTANKVYMVSATGLTPGSLFVNVGNEFGMVNPATGVITEVLPGSGLHGMEFIPGASTATPEPSAFGLGILTLAAGLATARRFRKKI